MIPTWANCEIDESAGGSVLVGPQGQRWQVYDAEKMLGPTSPFIAKCIFGPVANLARLPFVPTPYDLLFAYCVPQVGESLDSMREVFSANLEAERELWPNVPTGCVCYIRTNNLLSELDVANGIQACSELDCPVLIFRAWGSDVPQSAIDRVTYWRNGQPCPPQVLPPNPPPKDSFLLL